MESMNNKRKATVEEHEGLGSKKRPKISDDGFVDPGDRPLKVIPFPEKVSSNARHDGGAKSLLMFNSSLQSLKNGPAR